MWCVWCLVIAVVVVVIVAIVLAQVPPQHARRITRTSWDDSFHSKVVGVTHRNPDGSSRQAIIKRCRPGEMLLLVREPDNEYDPNAIAVHRETGEQVGYLRSEIAQEIAEDWGDDADLAARVENVTGGGRGKSHGLNIKIFMGRPWPMSV